MVELSYYNEERKEYIKHVFNEFLEVVGMSGNISWKEREGAHVSSPRLFWTN